jgi:hypothetical protein
LFDACPWLQAAELKAHEQTSGEETAESGDAGDAGYGDDGFVRSAAVA